MKTARLLALTALVLPFLYFSAAGASFIYRSHISTGYAAAAGLPEHPALTSSDRVLVFSPHPDDEALACSGLIQQAVEAGATVDVVYFTNGDGFRVAVERQYRKVRVGPMDCRRFGRLRENESRTAQAILGVPRSHVIFLGYPDGGLRSLWESFWAQDAPFSSPYTQLQAPLDRTLPADGTNYSGASVLQDVTGLILAKRPTRIYVTHAADDHPDHTAASAFVTLARNRAAQMNPEWSLQCRLYYYLVHRGDWPSPRGPHRADALCPPSELSDAFPGWSCVKLTEAQIRRKARAISAYASQMAMMRTFLLSFVRRTEAFDEVPPEDIAYTHTLAPGEPNGREQWIAPRAAKIADPVNDSLLRDFQGGADIRALYMCRDAVNLYLQVSTVKPIPRGTEFRVHLRYFGSPDSGSAGGTFTATIRQNGSVWPASMTAAVGRNCAQLVVPLRDLGYCHDAAIRVDAGFAGLPIDTTGYRFVSL